jgi:Outer membrane lipoprotein carrier protein LolA-like
VPRQERFIYEGGKITVETAGRQRQIPIGDQPALGALVESIRATLAGDEDALKRHYRLRLSGTRDDWNLEMSPLASDLLSRIRLIRISGVRDELRKMELLEASDDLTIMTIDAVRR